MAPQPLPQMHYITEPERAQVYTAVTRVASIPSIPSTFPFQVPQSPPRTRGPRFTIGWLEFHSPDQPDPEVARPGDVWIQLPLGHRKARVYACYARDGKDWSPWVGNAASIGDRTLVRTHPFLNSDHAQRRFYLVFNGFEFTWANIKAISNIHHLQPHIAKMGPADAVAKWLQVSGKRGGSRKAREERASAAAKAAAEKDPLPVSAPPPSRKHARPEANGTAAETVSAPPAKKQKVPPRERPPSPSEPSPIVRSGPYAKAGASQVGWQMYINGVQLKMSTPCTGCARDESPCSGLPGQRCGKCRFKKRWCSNSSSSRLPRGSAVQKAAAAEAEAATDSSSSSSSSSASSAPPKAKPSPRKTPAKKSRTPAKPKANATKKKSTATSRPVSRPRFSVAKSTSSSPLSSVHSRSDSDSESGEQSGGDELDAPDDRDDAAVENLLNNAAAVSVGPADDAEPSSSVTAVTATNGVERAGPRDVAEEDEEEEELTRFVQMTLDGMSRVQEGLRGVFTLQRRKSGVAKHSSPAK